MTTYYIEIYSNPYPDKGKHFRTWRGKYDVDCLSPGLYQLLKVEAISKQDAIAQCLLGKGTVHIG